MSATTTNGTAASPTPAVSPVEYIRGLSPEEQEEVLTFLLKEVVRIQGGTTTIVLRTGTEHLGYYLPPAAAEAHFRAHGPQLTPEDEAMLADRVKRLHEARPAAEVIADLNREADALRRQSA